MMLKEIGRKIAQVFRRAKAADEGIRKEIRTRASGTGSATGDQRSTTVHI